MSLQLDQTIHTKIMIVEDTLENLQQLSIVLSNKEYQVLRIANSQINLKVVEIEQPDLILISINMPDFNGYQFCRLLKESRQTCDIPVIFVSAYDQLRYKLQAFEVGGTDYISSPFQEQELLIRIKHQVLIQQQKKQLIEQNQALQAEITKRKLIEQTLQVQIEREKLLASVIQHIRQSLDIEEVLHTTVTEVRQILQSDRALIYKVETDGAGVIVSESDADNVANLQQYTLPEDIFPRSHHAVYLEGKVRVVIDVEQDQMAACLLETLKSIGVRSKLVVPIVINLPNQTDHLFVQSSRENVTTEAKLWGLLVFHQCFAPRIWQPAEVELIQQLANQVAVAIQQSYLFQKLQSANQSLEKIAITDPLTHVVNRRGFDQYLQKEWLRMLREQMPISLILCDIDYFKKAQ